MNFVEYITEVNTKQLEKFAVIKSIEKLAQPFIKEFRNTGSDKLIFRGMDKNIGKAIKQVIPRKDRQPKDTPQEWHDFLDDEFQRKHGWRARSEGVFTTANKSTASAYGNDSAIVIPVGDYKYLYNDSVSDLYVELELENQNEDTWAEEYNEKYDQDFSADLGTWYYDDIETGESDKDDAIASIADVEGIDEDEVEEDRLKWIPEIDEDEYIKHKQEELQDHISHTVRGYKDTNLKKAISSGVEIMFKTKKYLLIDKRFEKDILQYLKTGKLPYDRKQLEFDFEKDPKIRKQLTKILPFKHTDPRSLDFTQAVYKQKANKLKKKMKTKISDYSFQKNQKKFGHLSPSN